MSRAVRFAPQALEQAQRQHAWWLENRPSSPGLFGTELARALTLLQEMPDAGAPYPHARRPGVRRLLLSRTQNYVYYRVDEETVSILAVWSTGRRAGPRV